MEYFESKEKDADLIIVLACSVRQKPLDRIFGKIKLWKKLPQKPKIVITACVLSHDKKKLENKVDAIIDTKNFQKEFLSFQKKYFINKRLGVIKYSKLNINKSFNPEKNKSTSYIPIMSGCDNFCTYCVVPYTRGKEISRPVDDIISEIKNLVENGINEVTLLGQNVNSYYSKSNLKNQKSKTQIKNLKNGKYNFVQLLREIEKIKGLKKISFLTAHPKDMSDELIEWMGVSKKFSHKLHLPVQSGDNEILKKMNRHYTSENYIKLIENLKLKIKNLNLSTDIIVGFPSETKKQFKNTVKLCKKINFNQAYVSQYSPRPGTLASTMKNDVSAKEKKRRWQILNDLINKKRGR
ncbi:hypothetical protein A3F08_00430 [Candidatus Berkelbacteria bacterium RIFCSPHIGHO2_12_FULL_36_9]|uniref:Uncharacterized protein n=1 Tax=Candidatus Berkelbacteria bacterium RIFCSPHIGHO2_12_FULL_36_9 TaxID=1797469 RepID=A0A1F5EKB1_9BACT|nr:MAG: hypothetical protein A3F08_00430 [Candidatus Berkelbacteria bacterium RIFCSPHIGHO2_12_FULL_36_9]